MTIEDLVNFYKDKEEHYPISDAFISEGYMQTNNAGYILTAQKENKSRESITQKWHFIYSYIPTLSNLKIDAKAVYNLKCPELLLWMAEAAGVDNTLVSKAKDTAKKIIDQEEKGTARNKAAAEIKKIITWEMLSQAIQ